MKKSIEEHMKSLDKTIIDILDESAEKYPNNVALIYKGRELTYRQLDHHMNMLAKSLIKLGVQKGDHISIWLPNSLEWIICKFAIIKAGAVMIPVNTRYKAKEAEYILDQSDSNTLFMTDSLLNIDFVSMFKEICPEIENSRPGQLTSKRLPKLKNVILLSEREEPGFFRYSKLIESGADYDQDDQLNKIKKSIVSSDIVNIQYTSGTTGEPKGVMLTHHSMLLPMVAAIDIFKLTESDRLILPLPLFHCFANQNGLLPYVMTGGSIVIMETFDPGEELRLIQKYRCTVIYGVPTMYTMMLNHSEFNSYDLSSLRTGNLGGSPPPVKLVKDIINRMGVKYLTAQYGMTENSCNICATRIGDPPEVIAATVGRPYPLVEARVVDTNTREPLPPGKAGIVYLRGPYVMQGYYKKIEETKNTIDPEGWLNTGDLAMVDENGNFVITGRYKDLIMPGGENVSPAEVENIIFEHPAVKEVQVIGVPDDRLGEVVMAYAILKEDITCTAQEIIDFCKPRMANFKVPKYVQFLDTFPLTPTGKIQKFRLREKAIEELHLGQ